MGPGEKCNVATLLPRAYRKPRPNLSYPNAIDGTMLRAVIESSSEVQSADFCYSTYGTAAAAITSAVTDSPRIFVPRQIGFYPASIV